MKTRLPPSTYDKGLWTRVKRCLLSIFGSRERGRGDAVEAGGVLCRPARSTGGGQDRSRPAGHRDSGAVRRDVGSRRLGRYRSLGEVARGVVAAVSGAEERHSGSRHDTAGVRGTVAGGTGAASETSTHWPRHGVAAGFCHES